jgi:hypothetical protein
MQRAQHGFAIDRELLHDEGPQQERRSEGRNGDDEPVETDASLSTTTPRCRRSLIAVDAGSDSERLSDGRLAEGQTELINRCGPPIV